MVVSSRSSPSSPEIRAAAYHKQVVSRLQALLEAELVGVYAGGSIVLGGYDPYRSDLDLAAVCGGRPSIERKLEIGEALRHESLPCPARGLEFVLYPLRSVREATAEAGFELNLNTGRAMRFTLETDSSEASRHWFVIDRAILREHGRTLFGTPAHELFAPIPRETVLRALAESVGWHVESGVARDDDAVLNACRAWRYAAHGVWSSKPDAGRWAHAKLDDMDLISHALAARLGDGRLDRLRVEAFLRQVLGFLESASA